MVAVYQKALRLGTASTAAMDSGKVVSLIANDASRLFDVFLFMNEAIFAVPILVGTCASLHPTVVKPPPLIIRVDGTGGV